MSTEIQFIVCVIHIPAVFFATWYVKLAWTDQEVWANVLQAMPGTLASSRYMVVMKHEQS
jgi:hypothetical protein